MPCLPQLSWLASSFEHVDGWTDGDSLEGAEEAEMRGGEMPLGTG